MRQLSPLLHTAHNWFPTAHPGELSVSFGGIELQPDDTLEDMGVADGAIFVVTESNRQGYGAAEGNRLMQPGWFVVNEKWALMPVEVEVERRGFVKHRGTA